MGAFKVSKSGIMFSSVGSMLDHAPKPMKPKQDRAFFFVDEGRSILIDTKIGIEFESNDVDIVNQSKIKFEVTEPIRVRDHEFSWREG